MGKLKTAAPRVAAMAPRVGMAPKQAELFYQSSEWRELVRAIKRIRGSRCARAGCRSTERIIADHIVERKDGGAPLDAGNVELLCMTHHAQKTAAARRSRAQGSTYRGGVQKSGDR